MIRLLRNSLLLLAISFALVSNGTSQPQQDSYLQHAQSFWVAWTQATGYYDLGLAYFDDLIEWAESNEFDEASRQEFAALKGQCETRANAVRALATLQIMEQFSEEEIQLLDSFIHTEIGKAYFETETPLPQFFLQNAFAPDSERQIAIAANQAGLLTDFKKRFAEVTEKIRPVVESAETYRFEVAQKQIDQRIQKQDPRRVYIEPIGSESNASALDFMVEPFPATSAFIEEQGWKAGELNVSPHQQSLDLGDKAVFLVTFGKGLPEKQWVMSITAVPPTEKEQKLSDKTEPDTIYTCLGSIIHFPTTQGSFLIETTGPFQSDSASDRTYKTKQTRITLDQDNLQTGIDGFAEILLRIQTAKTEGTFGESFNYQSRRSPMDEAFVLFSKRTLAPLQLSIADEKTFIGSQMAFHEYFNIALQTGDIRNIMMKVLRMPNLVKLALGQVSVGLVYDSDFTRPLPNLSPSLPDQCYSVPLTARINGKIALYVRFIATRPIPPLQNTAGIFGIIAINPDDPQKRVIVRAIAGSRETPSSAPLATNAN